MVTLLPKAQYGSLPPTQPAPPKSGRAVPPVPAPPHVGSPQAITPPVSVSAVAPDLLLIVQEQRSLNGISTKGQSYRARNGPGQAPAKETLSTNLKTAKSIPLDQGDPLSTRQSPAVGTDTGRVNSAYISAGAEHGLGFTTTTSGPAPLKTQGLAIDISV